MDLFLSSGEGREIPTLLGPFKNAKEGIRSSFQNTVLSSYLEFWSMENVRKPIDSEEHNIEIMR
jgi:hypothetical protein